MITRQNVLDLFGALLNKMSDEILREQVIEVWQAGCAAGGWEKVEELKEIPFTLLTDTRGVNFIEHTVAVTVGAIALAEAQQSTYAAMPYAVDMDRLIAGGILHDVGKLMEIERDGDGGFRKSHAGKCARHPISGAILAAKAGMPDEVVNTIGCHAKEGDGRPQVLETVLIHQADFATFNPLVMLSKGTLIQ